MKKVKNYVKYAGVAALVATFMGTPYVSCTSYARAKSSETIKRSSETSESEYTKVLSREYKIEDVEKMKSDYIKLLDMLSERAASIFVGREVKPATITREAYICKLEYLFLYGIKEEQLLATFRVKGVTEPIPFLEVTAKLEEGVKSDAGQKKKVDSLCDLIKETIKENKK